MLHEHRAGSFNEDAAAALLPRRVSAVRLDLARGWKDGPFLAVPHSIPLSTTIRRYIKNDTVPLNIIRETA